jgi:recombinational DNA repair protein RecR
MIKKKKSKKIKRCKKCGEVSDWTICDSCWIDIK